MDGGSHPLRRDAPGHGDQLPLAVQVRQSGLEAVGDRLPWSAAAGGSSPGNRYVYLDTYAQPDYRRRGNLRGVPAALGACVGQRIRVFAVGAGAVVRFGAHAFRDLQQGFALYQRRHLLYHRDFLGTLSDGTFARVSPLEIIDENAIASRPAGEVRALRRELHPDYAGDSGRRKRPGRSPQQVLRFDLEQALQPFGADRENCERAEATGDDHLLRSERQIRSRQGPTRAVLQSFSNGSREI